MIISVYEMRETSPSIQKKKIRKTQQKKLLWSNKDSQEHVSIFTKKNVPTWYFSQPQSAHTKKVKKTENKKNIFVNKP